MGINATGMCRLSRKQTDAPIDLRETVAIEEASCS